MAATASTDSTGRRRYRSELREQQAAATRRAVVVAAAELFVANGWSATGVRDVANAAGVALETVYSHFSSKKGLLKAVIDTAAAGDDEPLALAERPEFVAMGKGRRSARLAAAAQLLCALQVRTHDVAMLLRQAAPADEDIAEMLRATRERQRVDVAGAVELVLGRPPTGEERDGVWAVVSPEVFLLLVDESGWTLQQYEAWITKTLERILPRS